MKKLLFALSFVSLLAGTASAQISITPRVSHSYHNMKSEVKVTDSATNNSVGGSDKIYSNSTRFTVEAGYGLGNGMEAIFDVGYMPYHEVPGQKADFMNYDLAIRQQFSDFYAQVGLGVQTFKYAAHNGISSASFNLPTVGFGAGYVYPLTSSIGLDIAYRGFRSIHESEKDSSKIGALQLENSYRYFENHELGLGVRFTL